MTYWIAIAISILISLRISHKKKQVFTKQGSKIHISTKALNRSAWISLSALGPMLVSAFRYGLGTDYFYTYIPQFKVIAGGGRSYYEIGFYLLNEAIALFTQNGQWLIIITSILFIGIVYYQVFELCDNYAFSLLIFYLSYNYFVSLNNIRQSLASAILLLALACLLEERRIMFVLFVILAGTMHQVAFVFLIFILIEKVCLTAYVYSLLSVIAIALGKVILPRLINFLALHIPRLALYYRLPELQKYTEETIGGLFILANIFCMLVLVYLEWKYSSNNEFRQPIYRREWEMAKMNQCIILCICAIDGLVPATYRLVRIFTFVQFILIPNAIYRLEKKTLNRNIILFGIVCIFGIMFIRNLLTGVEEVFPYVSIFQI